MDGTEDKHNTTRVLANGNPTFHKIWGNLKMLQSTDLDFSICLRVHISPDNVESVLALVLQIEEVFGGDQRFSIHFHNITDLGGSNSGEFRTFSHKEYSQVLASVREQSGLTLRKESELDIVASKGICYAAKPNSLLIRSNGRLGKCTVALENERNDVGSINPDGTLNVNQERWRLWLAGFEEMDEQLLGCPLSKLPSLPEHKRLESSSKSIPVSLNVE